jgi:hypothetical protein
MKSTILAIVIGLATSVVGGYAYTELIKIDFPSIYLIGSLVSIFSLLVIGYILRGKLYLLFLSSIVGYFPKGQSQYVNKAVAGSPLNRSKLTPWIMIMPALTRS